MKFVVGVDEAGRGPLAGPVSVGVVCAPEGYDFLAAFPGLNDSKKLSEKKREAIFAKMQEEVKAGKVRAIACFSSADIIDSKGISHAVFSALSRGVEKLMPNPEDGKVWLDGALRAPKAYEHEVVIGGDALIPAIMLASVVAKVSRDRLMLRLAKDYPLYGFEKHKGYGTASHYAALREHGLSSIHRRSFIHLDRKRAEA
jgi:ribonuclease HII